jgi:hypothetical protein
MMSMRKAILAIAVLAAPLAAEFRVITFTIADTGCASCAESLKKRLGRVRGVESAEQGEAGKLTLKLAEGNRVRIEQLRDFVMQGGNRIEGIAVEVGGEVEGVDGKLWFQPEGLAASYRAAGAVRAGEKGMARGRMDAKMEMIEIGSWVRQ